MGFGGRAKPAQPVLAVSTLEDVIEYIKMRKVPVPERVGGYSAAAWYWELAQYALTGERAGRLGYVKPSMYPVLAAYIAGEPVMYRGELYRGNSLGFCNSPSQYAIPPIEPVKSKTVRWKCVWTTSDAALTDGEPIPTTTATRGNPEYLGVLVVRDYYEDGVLVEQCSQFLPKF